MENNYIVIQGWMVTNLKLSGNNLLTYALIYGFTQDGESEFTGSINYICKWLNCSRPTVQKSLKELVEMNLIFKASKSINNVIFNSYKVNLQGVNNLYMGSKETLQGGVKKFNEGGKETLHNNTNNIINKDIIVNKDNKQNFNFPFSDVEFLGLWETIIKEPKWRKKSNTALQATLNKLGKFPLAVSVEALKRSLENGWQGIFPENVKIETKGFIQHALNVEAAKEEAFKLIDQKYGNS